MSYGANLWIYFILLFGIVVVPGMDMLFVIANSLNGGLRTGLSATAGIMLGGSVHSVFGLLLVTTLAKLSPVVFQPLVLAGALYMMWIGYTLARSSITVGTIEGQNDASNVRAFRQGTMTCLLNPKAYIFVMAVYPQFMKPEFGSMTQQAIIMGTMTVLTQGTIYGSIALAAGKARSALLANPRVIILLGRSIGILFIIVAAYTLWHNPVSKG
jgi:threonine/homoserine/homoserine lactone efflux protein